MNKYLAVLLLCAFLISACDNTDTPGKKDKTESGTTTVTEPAPAETPTVSSESIPTAETPAVSASQNTEQTVASEKAPLSGEQVYQTSCINCHKSGVANAPKLGDSSAWQPRIAKGKEALYKSAKQGIAGTAMMAKGTCSACSDEELEAAVDYMIDNSK